MGASGGLDLLIHPEWASTWEWLVQGTTCRPEDFALTSPGALDAWTRLRTETDCPSAVHARQPHGTTVGVRAPIGDGLHVAADSDGHLTRSPGALLGVTTADCVPATLVAPDARAVGMIHAGWRGAAGGILENGIARMGSAFGVAPQELHLHLGPSICGDCYEVGPEVHVALDLPEPPGPTPVDLPAALGRRAVDAGVPAAAITRSSWCTRCTGRDLLYSHRGGDAGRQIGFVGIALEAL